MVVSNILHFHLENWGNHSQFDGCIFFKWVETRPPTIRFRSLINDMIYIMDVFFLLTWRWGFSFFFIICCFRFLEDVLYVFSIPPPPGRFLNNCFFCKLNCNPCNSSVLHRFCWRLLFFLTLKTVIIFVSLSGFQ